MAASGDSARSDVLRALAQVYLREGQPLRALALALLALRFAPDEPPLLRTAARAFLDSGHPQEALDVIERLHELGADREHHSPVHLLRCRALWQLGQVDEASRVFAAFARARGAAAA